MVCGLCVKDKGLRLDADYHGQGTNPIIYAKENRFKGESELVRGIL